MLFQLPPLLLRPEFLSNVDLRSELRFVFISRRHQSDGLLGSQPQLRANLRGSQSPQRHTAKSSLEEDLKKLITLDSPPPTASEEKVYRQAMASY